jgi:hypothetical protein|tara:strand:- start:419 stop:763 length:345 start_codon:yes stop_codon:yes gene_type:complete
MTIQVDDFDVNDIIIRMKPNFTEERWNGYIDMEIITDNKRTMAKEDFIGLMQVASLVCSSLPLMELNEEFREMLCDYAENVIEQEEMLKKKDIVKESVANVTGNIIKVNFERSK